MQFYKGDDTEKKYYESTRDLLDAISLDLNAFFNGAYSCFVLGDVIWESKRSPLANAIPKDIFREAFSEMFETFLQAGSFEGYLSVFRKIFGNEVEVVFTIPTPGKLNININSQSIEEVNLASRYIENNQYFFDNLTTQEEDYIMAQSIKGMNSQYEVEQMLFELVPDGIYTEISLTMGA